MELARRLAAQVTGDPSLQLSERMVHQALRHVQAQLAQHGKRLSDFGMPEPPPEVLPGESSRALPAGHAAC